MRATIRTYCGSYEEEIPPSHKTKEVSAAFYSDKNNKLIAIARYHHPTGEIHDVYVSPGYRRKGYGMKILIALMRGMKRRGFKKFWLWTTSDNSAAINLYKKLGFREVSCKRGLERRAYTRHPWTINKMITCMEIS